MLCISGGYFASMSPTDTWCNDNVFIASKLRRRRRLDVMKTLLFRRVPAGPGARFTNSFLPAIQIRWKLCLAITLLLAIRSQQFFHMPRTAVVSCAKFCSDHCIRIDVKVKRHFHRIWIAMEKPLVKRAPDCEIQGMCKPETRLIISMKVTERKT